MSALGFCVSATRSFDQRIGENDPHRRIAHPGLVHDLLEIVQLVVGRPQHHRTGSLGGRIDQFLQKTGYIRRIVAVRTVQIAAVLQGDAGGTFVYIVIIGNTGEGNAVAGLGRESLRRPDENSGGRIVGLP